jgi:hypothetical protein
VYSILFYVYITFKLFLETKKKNMYNIVKEFLFIYNLFSHVIAFEFVFYFPTSKISK